MTHILEILFSFLIFILKSCLFSSLKVFSFIISLQLNVHKKAENKIFKCGTHGYRSYITGIHFQFSFIF